MQMMLFLLEEEYCSFLFSEGSSYEERISFGITVLYHVDSLTISVVTFKEPAEIGIRVIVHFQMLSTINVIGWSIF